MPDRPPPRRLLLLALLGGLAGCTGSGLPPADGNGWVRLPPGIGGLLTDADRRAVSVIMATLSTPARQEGDPAGQARALGYYEFATVALNAPRWVGLNPLAVMQLRQGRTELRDFYGIRQDAPAQLVLDGFFAAAAGLAAGDRTAAADSFPPTILSVLPGELIRRLIVQPPPALPTVARASAFAGQALNALDGGNADWPD